ncbi:hypothetical protein EV121DRAFT_274244 [Schizophyllum commune]
MPASSKESPPLSTHTWDEAAAIIMEQWTPRRGIKSPGTSRQDRALPPEPSLFDNLCRAFITPAISRLGELLLSGVFKVLAVITSLALLLAILFVIGASIYYGGKLVCQRVVEGASDWTCEHLSPSITNSLALNCPPAVSDASGRVAASDTLPSSVFTGFNAYHALAINVESTMAQPEIAEIQRALTRAVAADPVSREVALVAELASHLYSRLLASGSEDLKDLAAIVEEVDLAVRRVGSAVKDTAFALHALLVSVRVTADLALDELATVLLSQSVRACNQIHAPAGLPSLMDSLYAQRAQLEELLSILKVALEALRSQDRPMRHVQISLAEHEERLHLKLFKLLDHPWTSVRFRAGFGTAITQTVIRGLEHVSALHRIFVDTRSSVSVIELELDAITGHLRAIVEQMARVEVPCAVYLHTLQVTIYPPASNTDDVQRDPSLSLDAL